MNTTIQTCNPATGEVLKTYACLSSSEVDYLLTSSHQAYLKWRRIKVVERCAQIRNLVTILLDKKEIFATLMATEMGKPLAAGRSEIEKCVALCQYYADNAPHFLADQPVKTELTKSYICYRPQGVILAIMPWNYPFWQVFRCAIPNLLAGNCIALKHASIVTGCALALEQLFQQAGIAGGVFTTLVITEEQAKAMIAHPVIVGVTLTGSERVGKIVAAEAGKYTKKVVLELGGNDPYLILADADLDLAATACVQSRLANSGQVCISAKRLIVIDSVKATFLEKILALVKEYPLGNPLEEGTKLGPLAREDLRVKLHQQIEQCINKGAILLHGGQIPLDKAGFYYPPTVLDNVKIGTPAYEKELFGPVISVISAQNEAEALCIANASCYGLGAGIFTRDVAHGEKIAVEELEAGSCFVNQCAISHPALPFGGIKGSGYGRELAEAGIKEFVNTKTIVIR